MPCALNKEVVEEIDGNEFAEAGKTGELLTKQQSRCILMLYFELCQTRRRSITDAENLVSQIRETVSAGCFCAFLLRYECLRWVCTGLPALSTVLSI